MQLPVLTLPFISQFSALAQSGILGSLLLLSYLHKGARYLVSGLILAYVGYKTLVPISVWAYTLFKWIAMFGFYVTYFQIGVGFIATAIGVVLVFFENLLQENEKKRRNEQ